MVHLWWALFLHSVAWAEATKNCLLCINWYSALSILRAWICDTLFLWGYFLWPVFCDSEGHSAQKVKKEYSGNFNSLKEWYHSCTDCLF